MPNVIVEPEEGGTFAAIQNKSVIARGDTQLEAGEKAHEIRPNDHVVAARVRTTGDFNGHTVDTAALEPPIQ